MKNKQVQALFLRWLKNNNLFHIVKYCIANHPSPTFILERWLDCFECATKAQCISLITELPFTWNGKTHPQNFHILLPLTSVDLVYGSWEKVDDAWKKYFDLYWRKNKGY